MKIIMTGILLILSSSVFANDLEISLNCFCSNYAFVDENSHQSIVQTKNMMSERAKLGDRATEVLSNIITKESKKRSEATSGNLSLMGVISTEQLVSFSKECKKMENRNPSLFACAVKTIIKD